MSWQNFKSKILNSCPWSKDPEKQIKQISIIYLILLGIEYLVIKPLNLKINGNFVLLS